ncbi:PREDICTED: brain-specific serine protease 4 [Drosophila arizonae]|uniref:Brain-specific serine protease 4 n=1 Tax=Drosophila arizonae TaxID=7263 RepID=A0ABM1NNE6_DROAR|nr:PREDICTED: brain-specific serine protease 4 [Drosophila arizonae]
MGIVKRTLSLAALALCLRLALTQRLPPNGCGSIFQYRRQGDQWIGHVTPPQDGLKSVSWTLRFVSHGVNTPGTISSLAPYPSKEVALQNMHDGGRAECFVRFTGYGDELPKIVRIELNGQVLCTASSYEGSATTSTRELNMAVSSTTTYQMHETPSQPPTRLPQYKPIDPDSFFNQLVTYASAQVPTSTKLNTFTTTRIRPTATASPTTSFVVNDNPFLNSLASRRPLVTVDTRHEPAAYECGVEGLVGLQIGGETLPRGRFPWLAALYHDSNVDPNKIELSYKCVTTLISARTVITAAHCIYGFTPAQLRVYVGRHDISLHPEKDASLMAVQSVHTPPDFVGNLVPDLDVGLLVLTERVQYSTYVRPICLWPSSTSLGIDDSEQTAVAGWGIDANFKPTRFPSTVNVRPVSQEQCLREMVTAKDFLTPRTLCAGNSQGHGPCLGDSGGGLMVLRNNRWFVRGIVSLAQRSGNGCDLSRYVIYCDVARHLGWVERNIVR